MVQTSNDKLTSTQRKKDEDDWSEDLTQKIIQVSNQLSKAGLLQDNPKGRWLRLQMTTLTNTQRKKDEDDRSEDLTQKIIS